MLDYVLRSLLLEPSDVCPGTPGVVFPTALCSVVSVLLILTCMPLRYTVWCLPCDD